MATWKQETIYDIGDLLDSLSEQQIRMFNKLSYSELLDLEKAIQAVRDESYKMGVLATSED